MSCESFGDRLRVSRFTTEITGDTEFSAEISTVVFSLKLCQAKKTTVAIRAACDGCGIVPENFDGLDEISWVP